MPIRHMPVLMSSAIAFSMAPLAHAADTMTMQQLSEQMRQQQQIIEAQQQQLDALLNQAESASDSASGKHNHLSWAGYGVINVQQYDFYANTQTANPTRRTQSDLERIILAPTYDFGDGYRFVAEIEFEHGGTGSTVEYEAEEAGEFEVELEKGGEIVLEQAHLQIEQSSALNWRLGEILVPFGMINTHHEPSQYFTLERSPAETNVIPSVWHETGVELYGDIGQFRYQLQLISGLDSSRFSGPGFVSSGSQGLMEFKNADDIAINARLDYGIAPGVIVGGAVFFGNSANNRPRQNLDSSANVTLAEVHGRYETGALTVRGQALMGEIENADAVTQANYTTYNAGTLGISKTPVGSRAESWFIEAGYDLLSLWPVLNGRLDAFARFDHYNTHADTEGNISSVARYERDAATVGLNYKPRPGIVFKGEFSHREHQGDTGSEDERLGLGLGFEF